MPDSPDDAVAQDEIASREIVVSRLVDAPPDVVFQAYSASEHLGQWWGPNGFTTTTRSFEFREGGVWDFVMHGPDGTDYDNHVVWLEVMPLSRLVLLHGERADDPEAFTSTITFEERDRGTLVTMRALFRTAALRDRAVEQFGAVEGGEQTLGRLGGFVEARSAGRA